MYIYVCGTLSMFAGMHRNVHMCLHVAASPLSTEGNMGPVLLRAVTPFSRQIAFVPGLFSTAGNEEERFIININ